MSLPHPSSSLFPEVAVTEPPPDLLPELVMHLEDEPEVGNFQETHHLDPDGDYHIRREHTKHLPWWRRPSPWWYVFLFWIIIQVFTKAQGTRNNTLR